MTYTLVAVLPDRNRRNLPVEYPSTDVAEPIDPEAVADSTLCPRCSHKLVNPEGLGWCSKCGYCRSIEEEQSAAAVGESEEKPAEEKASTLGAAEFAQTVHLMPSWSRPLALGMLLIIGICYVGNMLLPAECLGRAAWATGQLIASLTGLIAAQLWVIMLVGATNETLSARDVFLPGRLWRAAIRGLPDTRKPVWLGAWSATAFVCSIALIGGFGYWLVLLQQQNDEKKLREVAAKAEERDQKSEKPAVNATPSPEPSQPTKAKSAPAVAVTAQCVVIGFQTDSSGNVNALVLARPNGDNLQLVGVVSTGITKEMSKSLTTRLTRMKRSDPLVPGLKLKGTTWVKPGVFCDVEHKGTEKGEIQEPKLKGLVD